MNAFENFWEDGIMPCFWDEKMANLNVLHKTSSFIFFKLG